MYALCLFAYSISSVPHNFFRSLVGSVVGLLQSWIFTEMNLQDNLVTPDDSASQVGIGQRNKPKPTECGSRSSRLSKTSSISTARAKEAARIAELRAEVLALNQRHSLQETVLLLRRLEYELQLKKAEYAIGLRLKRKLMPKQKQETLFQTKCRPLTLVLMFQMCPSTPRSRGPMTLKVHSLCLLKKKRGRIG